jgi:hypothetical protein
MLEPSKMRAMARQSISAARSNNRLKQTARGRSGAESLRRTRAAAYPER